MYPAFLPPPVAAPLPKACETAFGDRISSSQWQRVGEGSDLWWRRALLVTGPSLPSSVPTSLLRDASRRTLAPQARLVVSPSNEGAWPATPMDTAF